MWIAALLLLEIIVILGIGYLIIRFLNRKPKEVERFIPVEKDNGLDKYAVERAVREGMVSAIKQIEVEKAQEKYIEENAKRTRSQSEIYTPTDPEDAPVKRSGGNLVPFNLSQQEKEILNMFYDEN